MVGYDFMKLPKYRHRKDRDVGFVEVGKKHFHFPGKFNSPESLAAYNAYIDDYIQRHEDKSSRKPRCMMLILELCVAYLDHAKTYYRRADGRPGTEYGVMKVVVAVLKEVAGETYVRDFGPLMLKKVRKAMVKKKWTRTSINKHVNRIRRIFKWGVENEIVDGAVLYRLRHVQPLRADEPGVVEREPVGPVDPQLVKETLPLVNPVVRSMIELQSITGMRSENICLMRPREIDRSGEVWLYRPRNHKTKYRGKKLIVALGPKAQAILKPYLNRNPEDYVFKPTEGCQRPTKQMNSHYRPASYRRSIWYAIDSVNKKRKKKGQSEMGMWHPHQLRHNVGTQIRDTYGIEACQAVLGHVSLEASEIYTKKRIDLATKVVKELG